MSRGSRLPPPPLPERDGSLARVQASDAALWGEVKAAGGHPYQIPPEIRHLIPEGMQWNRIEEVLRPALLERARLPNVAADADDRTRRYSRKVGRAPQAFVRAPAAYQRNHPNFEPTSGPKLLAKLTAFATEYDVTDAADLDPDGVAGILSDLYVHIYKHSLLSGRKTTQS